MGDDDFAKIASKALEQLVVRGAGVAVAAAGGSPGEALAATVAASTGLEWFKLRATGKDSAIQAGLVIDMAEHFARLDSAVAEIAERLAKLELAPDRQDPLTQDAVYSDFAKAVSEAPTPEKREALVHVAAHQFNPEMGTPASRAYWMRRVSVLSDIEIATIKLFDGYSRIAFDGALFLSGNGEHVERRTIPLTDVVAFETTATELSGPIGPAQLMARRKGSVTHEQKRIETTLFLLTPPGQSLLRFISA